MVKIEENIDLKKYNTYGVGGSAKYFVLAKSGQDLVDAFNFAKEKHINYLVLGGGSNVLISDDGYDGIVIVNKANEIERSGNKVKVSSGASLARIIKLLSEEGLAGGEFLAGIPGTLGGAILGNAGAWGKSIESIIESVEFLNETGVQEIQRSEMVFSYRDSSFKKMEGIILSATMVFSEGSSEKVASAVKEILSKRSGKHPAGKSCGSFFKNIETADLSPEIYNKMRDWEVGGKVAAGKLIEEAGAKGMKVGGAEVSQMHANFLVNISDATAGDIKELAKQVKQKVYEKFSVELEPEVRYL
ncbi:MAG: UDP-N-acetylmuramate dehydrogenase [bacterium]|nr:UDP-N-acetylmuramate dehydrogenase [bacterium]